MTVSYETNTCSSCDQPIRKVKPSPQRSAIPTTPQADPHKWKTVDDDGLWFCIAGKGYHQPKR